MIVTATCNVHNTYVVQVPGLKSGDKQADRQSADDDGVNKQLYCIYLHHHLHFYLFLNF